MSSFSSYHPKSPHRLIPAFPLRYQPTPRIRHLVPLPQPRICHIIRVLAIPVLIPRRTAIVKSVNVVNRTLDLIRALEKLHAEAFRRVPRDMAMHDPGARIVRRECKDHPAARRKRSGVATCGIIECQVVRRAVPGVVAVAEEVKVVAVEMDWVRDLD